jgi:PAS domain S-box-containing protein
MPSTNIDPQRLPLTKGTRLYIGAVTAAGVVLLVQFFPREIPHPLIAAALLVGTLTLSIFKLRLPVAHGRSTMSMSAATDFTALLVVGPEVAMTIAAAGVLLQCTVRVQHAQPRYRTAFSVATVVIAVQAAGAVWSALGGRVDALSVATTLAPLSAAGMTYFVVNSGLVAGAIGLSGSVSPARAWYREFFWSAPSYFLAAGVAAVVALILANDAYVLLPLAAAPIYVSYRAYQMSVRRIEEERRHADQLAAMVVTTQEALARATSTEGALAAEKERLAIESARLADTLRTISDGVVTVDGRGSVLLMNDGAEKMTGLPRSRAIDGHIGTIFAAMGFPAATYEAALQQVLADGHAVHLRENEMEVTGSWTRLIEITGTPTRDGDGHVAGAVWVLRDVSDAARLEHERSKAARLESLGILAGGLAHDFNNVLTAIMGNSELLLMQVPAEDPRRQEVEEIQKAASSAAAMTRQLLTFSRKQVLQPAALLAAF